jgi:hypothetical protein
LINAVREFPLDNSLLFNKGLVFLLNREYKEAAGIYQSLLPRMKHRNLVLINLF